MKIVEIITFLSGGGAERFVVDLSNELAKTNDVTLLTLLDDKKEPEVRMFYCYEISDAVKYQNVGLPNGPKLSSQLKVLKTLNTINPDIIHFHMIPTLKYSALAIVMLATKYNIYFSVHSDLNNGYNKGFLKILCNTFGRINRFKMSCLSKKNYLDFKTFYPHTPIRCIVNGRAPIVPTIQYDEVRYEMSNFRATENTRLFIHVARFHPVKNQLLLISAFNEFVEKGYDASLIVIGAGFDTVEGSPIKRSACDRIHFVGQKKNVPDYVLSADIFCLSSDYEGMPITLLEASLAGIPAVSTPVCGAVDLIQNGVNGYLSNDHSKEEYVKSLENAFNNYFMLRANSERMKNNSPYTIAECARNYIDFFQS